VRRAAVRWASAVVGSIGLIAGGTAVSGVSFPVSGRAATWGWNADGQLGDNSSTSSTVPVVVDTSGVLAGKTITAVSAGDYHSCAVADGRAYCWGLNVSGGLGNNDNSSTKVPVAVDTSGVLAGRTITAISAGAYHTCAVADGRAYCWGYNVDGELGSGTFMDALVPIAVDTSGVLAGKPITAISAGYYHSCAVAEGRAYCWGLNVNGQLGNNSTTKSGVPVSVSTSGVLSGKTISGISAGAKHTCAVAEGRAYCWGNNDNGKLGNDSIVASKVPVAVDVSGVLAGATVAAVSAGYEHSCAVSNGLAYCWGYNGDGELGSGGSSSKVPVAVDTSGALAHKTIESLSAGGYSTCAIADRSAYCWGSNGDGALGNNGAAASPVPVAVDTSGVLGGKTVTALDCGYEHSLALFAAPPQPPAGVAGVPGDGHVDVSWTPPGDDGGSPMLDYTATADPGGATCTSTGTSCVVSGLANGTAYSFTVTARNAIGVSVPSQASALVIPTAAQPPVQPPGKTTGVKAKVTHGKVKVTWKAVAGASSYRLRISKPGGTTYKAWETTTKRVFKAAVKKGKKYRFQVAAVNAAGRGPVTTLRFKGK